MDKPSAIVVGGDGQAVTLESEGPMLDFLKYNPLLRLPEFIIGIVTARVFLALGAPTPAGATAFLVVTSALLVALLGSGAVGYLLIHNGLLAPVYAAVILALAADGTPFSRLLGTSTMRLLGDASYALYILHLPLYIVTAKVGSLLLGRPVYDQPLFMLIHLLISIGLSIVTYQLIEVPTRGRLRAFLAGAPAHPRSS